MSPLDALWHLLNFLAPAVFVALFTAVGAKLVFARRLHKLVWRSLLAWSILPAVAVAIAGLIVSGRDGSMLTYAAMVAAAALGTWFGGLVWRRG